MRRALIIYIGIIWLLVGCGGGGGGGSAGSQSLSQPSNSSQTSNQPSPTPEASPEPSGSPSGSPQPGGSPTPTPLPAVILEAGGFRLTIPGGSFSNPTSLKLATATTAPYWSVNSEVTQTGPTLLLSGNGSFTTKDLLRLEGPTPANANLLIGVSANGVSHALTPIGITKARSAAATAAIDFSGFGLVLTSNPLVLGFAVVQPHHNDARLITVAGSASSPKIGDRHLIVLHGINDSGNGVTPLAQALAATSEYAGVLVYQYDFTKGADTIAADLQNLLLQPEHPLGLQAVSIDLVAHSYGGIVARWFAEHDLAGRAACNHVVTLGAPHLGSLAGPNQLTDITLNSGLNAFLWKASDPAIKWFGADSDNLTIRNQLLGTVRLTAVAGTRYHSTEPIADAIDLMDLGLSIAGAVQYGDQKNDGVVSKDSAIPLIPTNGLTAPNTTIERPDRHHVNLVNPATLVEQLLPELRYPFGQPIRRVSSFNGGPAGIHGLNGSAAVWPQGASVDGRYCVFTVSNDYNFPWSTSTYNTKTGIVLVDQRNNSYELISAGTNGQPANDACIHAAISADGRYVAFDSLASNLVAGDTNNHWDVFVRDRLLRTTTRISVAPNGQQGNADSGTSDTDIEGVSIAADGQHVAYSSFASNLVAGDTNGYADIFVWDRPTNTTERISQTPSGGQINASAIQPSLSGDGSLVTYTTGAGNMPGVISSYPGESETVVSAPQLFSYDRSVHETKLVSRNTSIGPYYGRPGNRDSIWSMVSANGRYIVYMSTATWLVNNDTNHTWDVFRYDRQADSTIRVSVDSAGHELALGSDATPSISANGRFVAMNHITKTAPIPWGDILVWDAYTGVTTLASVDSHGNPADNLSNFPAISADGHTVFCSASASNFAPNQAPYAVDVFQVGNPCLP